MSLADACADAVAAWAGAGRSAAQVAHTLALRMTALHAALLAGERSVLPHSVRDDVLAEISAAHEGSALGGVPPLLAWATAMQAARGTAQACARDAEGRVPLALALGACALLAALWQAARCPLLALDVASQVEELPVDALAAAASVQLSRPVASLHTVRSRACAALRDADGARRAALQAVRAAPEQVGALLVCAEALLLPAPLLPEHGDALGMVHAHVERAMTELAAVPPAQRAPVAAAAAALRCRIGGTEGALAACRTAMDVGVGDVPARVAALWSAACAQGELGGWAEQSTLLRAALEAWLGAAPEGARCAVSPAQLLLRLARAAGSAGQWELALDSCEDLLERLAVAAAAAPAQAAAPQPVTELPFPPRLGYAAGDPIVSPSGFEFPAQAVLSDSAVTGVHPVVACREYALALLQCGRVAEAGAVCMHAGAHARPDVPLLLLLADACVALGDVSAAAAALERARAALERAVPAIPAPAPAATLVEAPDGPMHDAARRSALHCQTLHNLALVHVCRGEMEAAETMLQRALAVAPSHAHRRVVVFNQCLLWCRFARLDAACRAWLPEVGVEAGAPTDVLAEQVAVAEATALSDTAAVAAAAAATGAVATGTGRGACVALGGEPCVAPEQEALLTVLLLRHWLDRRRELAAEAEIRSLEALLPEDALDDDFDGV